MSGNTHCCHKCCVCVCACVCTWAIDTEWVKARDVAKSPTKRRMVSTVKKNLDPNVISAETDKHCACFSPKILPVADAASTCSSSSLPSSMRTPGALFTLYPQKKVAHIVGTQQMFAEWVRAVFGSHLSAFLVHQWMWTGTCSNRIPRGGLRRNQSKTHRASLSRHQSTCFFTKDDGCGADGEDAKRRMNKIPSMYCFFKKKRPKQHPFLSEARELLSSWVNSVQTN